MRKSTILVYLITIVLFFIPFFWLTPGEMDLGGDSSRLYFYDPLAYLTHNSLYGVTASGFGYENINYFAVPFLVVLTFFRFFLSPTLLISVFHGMTLALSFYFTFAVIKELAIKNKSENNLINFAAILGGLLYAFSPAFIDGWQYVLLSRSQLFLNPLMFYLLLRYFKTQKTKYILISLFLSVIFSPNFSIISAPALIAFYPISIIFLFVYTKLILKVKIYYKQIFLWLLIFVFLQSFHVIPQIADILSPGSVINATIFSDQGKYERGLSYFVATAENIKVVINLIVYPQMRDMSIISSLFLIFPFLITISFFFKKNKTILLFALFFFVILFFATANITGIGFAFYKKLFDIPGFSMFRNYYGQWQFVYIFYYAVLLGLSLTSILSNIPKKYAYSITILLFLVLTFQAIPFIHGDVLRRPLWQSKNVSPIIQIDPGYEKMLVAIQKLPIQGKILTLPLTDYSYQLLGGKNNGVYEGPSTISYLAGKKDFSGYEEFLDFKVALLDSAKTKNYEQFKKLLGFLNIKYIFYNADPHIYDEFPGFPYANVKNYFPNDQGAYAQMINELGLKEIKNINNMYYIYEIPDRYFLPDIYGAKRKSLLRGEVFDVHIPLSWNIAHNKIGVYAALPSQEIPQITFDDTYIGLQNKSDYLDFFKNTKDERLPWAFVSQSMDSYAYPLVVWRENKKLSSPIVDDVYIDTSILYAEKRVNELLKFGKNARIIGGIENIDDFRDTWKEPTFSQALFSDTYNAWEVSFVRYSNQIATLITHVSKPNQSAYSSTTNKELIHRVLIAHKAKIFDAIRGNESFSEEKKLYLTSLTLQTFDGLMQDLNRKIPQTNRISYSLDTITEGIYDIYIDKNEIDNIGVEFWEVMIGSKVVSSLDFIEEDEWYVFNNFPMNGKDNQLLAITFPEFKSLIQGNEWRFIKESSSSATTSQSSEKLSFSNGLVWEVPMIQKKSYYKLTFEYKTQGKDFILNWYELEKENQKRSKPNFSSELRSEGWETYGQIFYTKEYSNSGFLQITKEHTNSLIDNLTAETPNYEVEIRNFSLTQIPNPKVVLKKSLAESQVHPQPKISFQKINPTKYRVHIRDADKPYMLFFSQGYTSKWHIIDTQTSLSSFADTAERFLGTMSSKIVGIFIKDALSEKIVKNYGDALTQKESHDIFLDTKTFETWGKKSVAENQHFVGNGYANAWYITPEDMNGKNDYTLVIEMESQKIFYISVLLSFGALFFVICYLIYRYIRK